VEDLSIHAIVTGRVQGVYYRASLRREAVRLGLNGCVKNLGDGGVEFFARGSALSVDTLVKWSRQGPPLARVTGIEVLDSQIDECFDGFEIRS
jgi:acylphosphatase